MKIVGQATNNNAQPIILTLNIQYPKLELVVLLGLVA